MSVSQQVSSDGRKVFINISGRFDYKLSQSFRDSYRRVNGLDNMSYYVDLSDANYMDSSALGMLLLLREHAKAHGGVVIIEQPSKPIDNILKVANFEQLFTINNGDSAEHDNVIRIAR